MRVRIGGGALTLVAAAGTSVVVAAMVSFPVRGRPLDLYYDLFLLQNGPSGIILLWLSTVVLRRQPRHVAGLILFAIGLFQVAHAGVAALLDTRLVAAGVDVAAAPDTVVVPAELPLDAALLLWVLNWLWVPAAVSAMTLLPLLFPDGRLPSSRWRPLVGVAGASTLLIMLSFAVDWWPRSTTPETEYPSPVGAALLAAGGVGVLTAAAAGVVALVRRWRRAGYEQRRPFRMVGAAVIAATVVGTVLYPWQQIWVPAILVAYNLLFIAYALAVARYRLHDLEPVLGRTAVGTILALLVTGVYLAIVVGVGSLVGRGVEGTLLPLLAVGVIALMIEPARRWARRLVDQLLYGRRTDRAEVMSRLAVRASTAVDADDILAEVVQLLVGSTGAERAEVWLAVQPQPTLAASAGASDWARPVLRVDAVHQGERLGNLRLYARAAADLTPDAGRVLDDVANSLGVVLRNARLTAQLRAQLEELHASRQRLVEVHEQARRGLERDIHDGAQARLISLRLRLGLLRAGADTQDRAVICEQLDVLAGEVDAAVRTLRELARGLQPPILEQAGVAVALRAYVRDLPVAVAVTADGVGRYSRAVEGAVYFSCLEAVQNAIRHAAADSVGIQLAAEDTRLRFCVRDDGAGFDRDLVKAGTGLSNIDDRVSALGGRTSIETGPGRGTLVRGEIPAQPLVDER